MQGRGFEYRPAAVSHVYWRQKREFQLPSDTYADWVLFAVTAGRFRYKIGEAEGEAGFGDAVFCPPHVPFERQVVDPVSFHFYTFRWRAADELLHRGTDAQEPRPCGGVAFADHERLSSTYAYLQQAQHFEVGQRIASVEALFCDLWHQLCLEGALARRPETKRVPDEAMAEAARWIRKHAFEALRLKEYAASAKLSPVQLTRRFRSAWGQTPMEYVTSLRLEKAKTLLLETRLTLDDIAAECGYENGFYLSRMFMKKLRVSPSQYRSLHRL
ncbi:AraC family transcriptional regulator [Gordoniibacillus kamchatkensis]|uniref:AraC family transcriptional regulator n=1 Tax=Gordoniibacillus kamchatkensis TaxID=1590651 RepID=UPI000697ABE6|nr:AraC family transcriptional regulator [Paenibacillus sp. VKM B-2647]